jgi:multidrug efflux pump subunit AcrB
MRFNISAVAIRNPIPPIVLFILLTIAGLIAFLQLDITDNPDIDVPIVSVVVSRPGSAPTELETQVTRKIEDSIAGLGSIDHIQSKITDGTSVTSVEFAIGTNTDRAVNDVRDAVSKIRQNLPQDILEPVVQRVNIAGQPILYYSIVAPGMSVEQLSWFIDNDVARAMLSVKGVALIQRIGGVDREIRVELDPGVGGRRSLNRGRAPPRPADRAGRDRRSGERAAGRPQCRYSRRSRRHRRGGAIDPHAGRRAQRRGSA